MSQALLFLFFCLSFHTYASSRIKKHQYAVDKIEKLNFFYKGRGMVISPNLVKFYDILKKQGIGVGKNSLLHKRWGLNLKDNEIKGLFSIPYKKYKMGVLGCVACHSSRVAGQYVIGLGNKNIDVGQIGKDSYMAQFVWGALPRADREFREMHRRAQAFTKVLKDNKLNNLTQGLVPTSQVKTWFYDVTNTKRPKNFGRGQVKVPHLWGYGEKRKTGSFWDGFADGVLPGWAVAVELRGGQSPENIKEIIDDIHHAEDLFSDLLPPKYPFDIKQEKATRGALLFGKTCAKCHGTYEKDGAGLPIYKGSKFIKWKYVRTDNERLDFVTDDFLEVIKKGPLFDIMKTVQRKDRYGYVAPRLEGVWSRFPYLHNASIPNVYELLISPDKRSKVFDLRGIQERKSFDERKLGLNVKSDNRAVIKLAKKNKRYIYDTSRIGHSNQGHYFGFMKKYTDQDRTDIIEYLKTL